MKLHRSTWTFKASPHPRDLYVEFRLSRDDVLVTDGVETAVFTERSAVVGVEAAQAFAADFLKLKYPDRPAGS